ncbi:ribosomal protein S18 acetylase RimI-like enzyme [Evansella vedderi]|uniref:Ribosomal protein S18 acetylase RimI-like enzyme n=1 Tax=Evansella vedderi TaxID=38282 RepID=A0ABT9ZZ98_9BACI|nr:GNAT family N-acetyltransferase [Evansella vedderi]MDQ0256077.1 ribosomal protein S18 acetylase RimI-like enzyme [Evansella vedderi]
MNKLIIRRLVEDDLGAYWTIRLEALQSSPEAFASTYEETLAGEDPKQNVKHYITGEGMATYGVFLNGQLAAIGSLRRYPLEKMKHKGSLQGMYVSKGARGQGIGRKLIQEIIQKGKEQQIEQIQLMVITHNYAAKSLYKSQGFETYGVEKKALKHKGEYWDEELMALYLD